jgi:hypothetical protein
MEFQSTGFAGNISRLVLNPAQCGFKAKILTVRAAGLAIFSGE